MPKADFSKDYNRNGNKFYERNEFIRTFAEKAKAASVVNNRTDYSKLKNFVESKKVLAPYAVKVFSEILGDKDSIFSTNDLEIADKYFARRKATYNYREDIFGEERDGIFTELGSWLWYSGVKRVVAKLPQTVVLSPELDVTKNGLKDPEYSEGYWQKLSLDEKISFYKLKQLHKTGVTKKQFELFNKENP
ncbi:MAG: hypothetical protein V4691_10680 [Pseudomonadota bacterium]